MGVGLNPICFLQKHTLSKIYGAIMAHTTSKMSHDFQKSDVLFHTV